MPRVKQAEDFWAQVDRQGDTDCWKWTGHSAGGYGRTDFQRKKYATHRLALSLSGVHVPDDKDVCHHCDNPLCCNPTHLFVGTHRENMLDMCLKGRRGKLSKKEIQNILKRFKTGEPCKKIALVFGICETMIRAILLGKTYHHWTGIKNGNSQQLRKKLTRATARKIVSLRRKDLSLRKIAIACGVHLRTVGRVANGKHTILGNL